MCTMHYYKLMFSRIFQNEHICSINLKGFTGGVRRLYNSYTFSEIISRSTLLYFIFRKQFTEDRPEMVYQCIITFINIYNVFVVYILLENWAGNDGKGVYAWLSVGCTGVNSVRSPFIGVPGFADGDVPEFVLLFIAAELFVVGVSVLFAAEKRKQNLLQTTEDLTNATIVNSTSCFSHSTCSDILMQVQHQYKERDSLVDRRLKQKIHRVGRI